MRRKRGGGEGENETARDRWPNEVDGERQNHSRIEAIKEGRLDEAVGAEARKRRSGTGMRAAVALCAAMPRTVENVAAEIGCGRTAAYRHIAAAAEAETALLRRDRGLPGLPALLGGPKRDLSSPARGFRFWSTYCRARYTAAARIE